MARIKLELYSHDEHLVGSMMLDWNGIDTGHMTLGQQEDEWTVQEGELQGCGCGEQHTGTESLEALQLILVKQLADLNDWSLVVSRDGEHLTSRNAPHGTPPRKAGFPRQRSMPRRPRRR